MADTPDLATRIRQSIDAPSAAAPQETSQQPQAAAPAPSSEPSDLPTEFPAAQGIAEQGASFKDTLLAPLGAVRDAVQGVWDGANAIGPAVTQFADKHGLNPTGMEPIADGSKMELPKVDRAADETTIGYATNVSRDVGKFVLGFLGGSRILGSMGVATNTFKGATAAGALGDFLVTGKDDGLLFQDFYNSFPALEGPVREALHMEGDGSNIWMHKVASAAEGMLGGAAIEGVLRVVGIGRRVMQARREGGEEAAAEVLKEAAPELEQALKEVEGAKVADGALPPMRENAVQHEATPNGQLELFPEVVRREDAIHDIQLQIKGDRWLDPETGKEKLLPLSNRAREELTATVKDPNSPVHIDKLTPETREELLRVLASDNEAARFFAPKTVRGQPFALDDARRAEFDTALETSLSVPYATLKAERPGTAIEDVLGTYFNYRYMDSADQVKASLSQLAEVMRPMVDKHVGGFPQTFDRVKELADWIGAKPDTLIALMSQQARGAEMMPAMVVASKTWIQSLLQDIIRINRQIDSGLATDTAKIELLRRKDILADLVSTTKSVQTAGARTTAAGRIRTAADFSHEEVQTLLSEVGADNFRYISKALQLTDGSPKAVLTALDSSLFQKGFGVLNETWINGLLSGPATHIVNMVTGLRNTALFPLFRAAGGLLTGDMKSVRIGIGQFAAVRSTVYDSLEMARRALVTENAYVDSAFHQVERENLWIKADTFGQDSTETIGAGIDFLGKVIRMPSRFLTAEDEFLKQMNYRASVISRAKVEAVERGLKDDLTVSYFVNGEKKMVSQVDEYVMDRMNEAFHPRLENGTDAAALNDARRSTFTGPLKTKTWGDFQSLGEMVQQAAAKSPFLRHTVLPFTRVPTNILREMIYESPAAPLRAQFWADVKAGGEARSDAVGRMALGSLFWTGGAMLALDGTITGRGPSDPVLLKQLKARGWQPYSVKVGDNYVSYNRLDPTAGMLGIISDFVYLSAHVDERTQDQLASTLVLSLANNLNSRSYLRSLTELTAVLGGSNSAQGANAADRWLKSRASSYVPRAVSVLDTDDTLRDARDAIEAVMAKVPGLSTTLPPQRDNFGAPIMAAPGWPINEINPFAISMGKEGPARKELAYWAESKSRAQFIMPHSTIGGALDLRDFKNPNTGQNAYDRWMELLTEPRFGGKNVEERMDELVKSDGYQNMKAQGKEDPFYPKHPASEFLRDQLNNHYGMAQKMMLAEPGFEDLRTAMQQYEVNKRTVPLGASPPPNATLQDLLLKKR